jgi:hypothetical protein
MNLLENHFLSLDFDKDRHILRTIWKSETENMTEEEYFDVFLQLADIVKTHNVKYWFGDTREFRKAISLNLQEWVANTLNPKLSETELRKMALLVPSELIAMLSLEQSIDEINAAKKTESYEIQYFDSEQAALNWFGE